MFDHRNKAIGSHMSYYFKITQPSVDLNFQSIIYRTNLVFVLQLDQHLSDTKLIVSINSIELSNYLSLFGSPYLLGAVRPSK